MKVLSTMLILFTMNIGSSWSAVSLASIPGTKHSQSQIPERKLTGGVEAQMDAEDASKSPFNQHSHNP